MQKKLLIASLCASSLFSCHTHSSILTKTEHTTIKTDTLREVSLKIDTFLFHDSVFVNSEKIGDTVFLTKYKERTKYLTRLHSDTVYKVKNDTVIQKTTEKQQIVKKERDTTSFIILSLFSILNCALIFFAIKKSKK